MLKFCYKVLKHTFPLIAFLPICGSSAVCAVCLNVKNTWLILPSVMGLHFYTDLSQARIPYRCSSPWFT